jgi:phosphoribosylamine---glycine ligase
MQTKLNLLVVGGGGREHALAWKLKQSPRAGQIYIAPGNAGTAAVGKNVDIPADDIPRLVAFARERAIDLTVVGPEGPLAAGIVDAFQLAGLRVFGPSFEAARLESSKAFAKSFMQRYGIPTGASESFDDYNAALKYVEAQPGSVVIKADGLAAGKGVIVCDDKQQARDALRRIMQDETFGEAGGTVLIEERLFGPELSVLAFCDGKRAALMPSARDHKRARDGDQGPNTGGMGAYAPVQAITADLIAEIERSVLRPAVEGMAEEGSPYIGVLYAGLMLTESGPKTLEFNCRFGDPEAQALLPLLATDLVEIMLACINGTLDKAPIAWNPGACAAVVAASPGYPDSYPKGLEITGLDQIDQALVFHAGTARSGRKVITTGGRVLAVSAVGDDLDAALQKAYASIEHIHFEGIHYRRDIGKLPQ